MRSRLRLSPSLPTPMGAEYGSVDFAQDVAEMRSIEAASHCRHERWYWLDCDDCRETIGSCGEKVCEDCGADVS